MARLFALRGIERQCQLYLERYMKVASNRFVHLDFEDFDKYRDRDWFKLLSTSNKRSGEVMPSVPDTNMTQPLATSETMQKRRFVRVRKKSQKRNDHTDYLYGNNKPEHPYNDGKPLL